VTALWDLVWAGRITNDTLAPLRTLTGGGKTAHSTKRSAPRSKLYRGRSYARPTMVTRVGPPTAGGRWSLLPDPETDATIRGHALGDMLLERYGVVTKGAVMAERIVGGFALAYRLLSGFEETGRARRGYFVETLGASQFATGGTIDRLRSFTAEAMAERHPVKNDARAVTDRGVTLAATDPANPYGAALPWPGGTGHRPGRKAGALVVLVDGRLVLYVERGGKTLLSFAENDDELASASASLAATVISGRVAKLTVEKVNGQYAVGTDIGRALEAAGFGATPQGLRLRAS
jgi:ATP-dependent Lhr-like helicase